MATDFRVTDARANAALDALFGTSANSGKLRIYEGSLSSGAPTTPSGTLLAELTMNATAFDAAAAVSGQSYNELQGNPVTADSSADATGTAGCFVLFDSAGTTPLMEGTVGTSSADMIIDSTSIAVGANVSINADGANGNFHVRLPKGWSTA